MVNLWVSNQTRLKEAQHVCIFNTFDIYFTDRCSQQLKGIHEAGEQYGSLWWLIRLKVTLELLMSSWVTLYEIVLASAAVWISATDQVFEVISKYSGLYSHQKY